MNISDMVVTKIMYSNKSEDSKNIISLIESCGFDAINKSLDKKGTSLYIAEKPFELFKYLHESSIYTTLYEDDKHPLSYGSSETVEYLLENNFDINALNGAGENGLFRAKGKRAKYLIEKGIDIHAVNDIGQNALFRINDIEALSLLLENGIKVNQVDTWSENALFWSEGNIKKINLLLSYGIDKELKNEKDNDFIFNYYFLNMGKRKLPDMIEIGIKHGMNMLSYDPLRDAPNLLFCLEDAELLKKYKTLFASLINNKNVHGDTALGYTNNHEKIEILLDMGVDCNVKNKSGRTALFNNSLSLDSVELLISKGLNVNAKDNMGDNALCTIFNDSIIKLLIEYGIDYSKYREKYLMNNKLGEVINKIEIMQEKEMLENTVFTNKKNEIKRI